jgi:CDP-diacylglycerol--glycerol-3-phosphate 3-phosphatidyltransferase
MGKSDRAFVFGLLGLLLALEIEPGWWVNAALVVIAALTALTIFNRVSKSLRELG